MLGLCALIALAVTSCKKEQKPTEMAFTATINQPVSGDRTQIGGNGRQLVWIGGETVTVFNANGAKANFTASTDAQNPMDATLTGTIEQTDTYTAFYPNAVVNGNTVTLALNENQNYVNNNFGNDTYPMAAASQKNGNDIHFEFHSPAMVLRLQFRSDNDAMVKKIILTGGANDVLAGDIVYSDFSAPTTYTVANPKNTVTLDCGNEGVRLAANQVTAFNLVVLGGTLSSGATVVVKDMNDYTITTMTTNVSNDLPEEFIITMPVKDVNYDLPTVFTDEPTGVTTTGNATMNGHFTVPAGVNITEVGFYWGNSEDNLTNKQSISGSTSSPMAYNLTGLNPGTYYYRAYVNNSFEEILGSPIKSFTIIEPVPTVTTNAATNVTSTGNATMNGEYTANGATITEVGFYWGTSSSSLTNHEVVTGSTASPFVYTLTGLAPGTYYFKAYAKTSTEILATNVEQFSISVPGAYSTSPTRQVVFAPANLQYNLNPNASQSSTTNPQWRFAANQWEFLGENENVTNLWYRTSMEHHDYYMQVWANVGITDINVIQTHWTTNHNYLAYYAIQTWPADFETADSKYWMDLFCWGTSGYGMQPWNVQRDNEINGTGFNRGHDDPSYGYTNFTFPGYSDRTGYSWYLPNNQDISGTNYDWGQYNAIYNPRSGQIDAAGTWRTLTGSYYGDGQAAAAQGEWYYLMHVRSASTVNGTANARYCKARIQVNGNWINGLILFPDEYTHPAGVAQPQQINESEVRCSVNSYTTSDWAAMEQAYATFLPCAGTRFGWGKFEIVQDPRYGFPDVTAPNINLIRAYADNNQGYYWSSTHRHNVQAGDLRFLDAIGGDQANVNGGNNYNRDLGCAIRLAKTVVGVDPWLEE